MRFVTLFSPPLTSTYNDNVLQSLSCDTRAEAQDATTGDENLDVLLLAHLRLCQGLLQVHSSLGAPRALPAIVDPDYSRIWCLVCLITAERLRMELGALMLGTCVLTQSVSCKTLLLLSASGFG